MQKAKREHSHVDENAAKSALPKVSKSKTRDRGVESFSKDGLDAAFLKTNLTKRRCLAVVALPIALGLSKLTWGMGPCIPSVGSWITTTEKAITLVRCWLFPFAGLLFIKSAATPSSTEALACY